MLVQNKNVDIENIIDVLGFSQIRFLLEVSKNGENSYMTTLPSDKLQIVKQKIKESKYSEDVKVYNENEVIFGKSDKPIDFYIGFTEKFVSELKSYIKGIVEQF